MGKQRVHGNKFWAESYTPRVGFLWILACTGVVLMVNSVYFKAILCKDGGESLLYRWKRAICKMHIDTASYSTI